MSTIIDAYKLKDSNHQEEQISSLVHELREEVIHALKRNQKYSILDILVADNPNYAQTILVAIENQANHDVFLMTTNTYFTKSLDNSPMLIPFSYDSRSEELDELSPEIQDALTSLESCLNFDRPVLGQGTSHMVVSKDEIAQMASDMPTPSTSN